MEKIGKKECYYWENGKMEKIGKKEGIFKIKS